MVGGTPITKETAIVSTVNLYYVCIRYNSAGIKFELFIKWQKVAGALSFNLQKDHITPKNH